MRPDQNRDAPLTIAVLGANGRLGSTVAAAAARRGHRTIAVTRGGAVPEAVAAAAGSGAVEGRAADALDPAALTRAVAGADVVVNALNPPYTDWRAKARPIARAVIEACAAAGAHHLFPGNVYGFGRTMPPVLRPDTPERPSGRKGAIRHEVEAAFREAAEAGRVRTTVLRAGDFFGGVRPGGSWFDLVIAPKLAKGRVTYPGPMDVPHAWAYLPDLARDLVDLAERHRDLPSYAVLGHAGVTLTGAALTGVLEAREGRPLKAVRLRWPPIRLLGLVHPMSREVAEMAYLWSTPHRIDGQALEDVLGPRQPTDPHAAFGAALAALRA